MSVVMPAHNEAEYLAPAVVRVAEALEARGELFEILICENGSTDRTAEVAERLAGEHAQVRLLRLDGADYGRALRAGFLAARGSSVASLDVDLVDMAFVEAARIRMAAQDHPAIVVGSKRNPGADDSRSVSRRLVTAVFVALLRVGFGLRVSDTHGLKLLAREPLAGLLAACRFGGDLFDTELVLRAERAGLGVAELPVHVKDVRPPRTSIVRRIPRTLWGMSRLWLALDQERRRGAPSLPAPAPSPERPSSPPESAPSPSPSKDP